MTILHIDDLSFAYHKMPLLKGINLSVKKGDFWAFIGPNGSGKTTLLKLINGTLFPQKGHISLHNRLTQIITRQDMAKMMAVVPQGFSTYSSFTVLEIILMGRIPHLKKWQFEQGKDMDIVQQAMEKTDTIHLANRSVNHLSGGEIQRVLIARALAQEPQLLLLDEPTTFLDFQHQGEIMNLIRTLNEKENVTVILVTHDINLASLYCNPIALLKNGTLEATGHPNDVITEKNMQTLYETPVLIDRHPLIDRPRITLPAFSDV